MADVHHFAPDHNFSWDDSDNSFSSLLNEIEIFTNFQPSFKNSRNHQKGLRQVLTSTKEKVEDLKSKDYHMELKFNKLMVVLEEQKSQNQIEDAKKILNGLKKLMKLKWVNETSKQIDGLVFNEKTGYLKYFSYNKTESIVPNKLVKELYQAANYCFDDTFY